MRPDGPTLFLSATRAGARFAVRIDGQDRYVTRAVFVALVRLLAARVEGEAWVRLAEIPTATWKLASRLRRELRTWLPEVESVQSNGAGGVRLAGAIVFLGADWLALAQTDPAVDPLVPALRKILDGAGVAWLDRALREEQDRLERIEAKHRKTVAALAGQQRAVEWTRAARAGLGVRP